MRSAADACPGVLRPFQAADGALVRLRVPGGRLSLAALGVLSQAAALHADGNIALTSRANLQMRGITLDASGDVDAALREAVVAAGLLSSPSHELVRNICLSPLSGIAGGLADIRGTAAQLDALLCAEPRLAALPGRFFFVVDDGRGDVLDLRSDLAIRALDTVSCRLRIGDQLGAVVSLADAPRVLIELALEFLRFRGTAWHLRELDAAELGPLATELLGTDGDPAAGPADAVPADAGPADAVPSTAGPADAVPSTAVPVSAVPVSVPRAASRIAADDATVALSVHVPLGVLTARHVEAITAAGASHIILTPWRGFVMAGLSPDDVDAASDSLTAAGLVMDEGSIWTRISACTGSPGCAKSAADTHLLAAELAAELDQLASPLHISGCERRCGSPAGRHLAVLAGHTTYDRGTLTSIVRPDLVAAITEADLPA
ncbi:precorrin-3B synthase [Nakamurella antarctica]|uniref:Precorrin-3B synthase n=1 Tax=Nakamurella antarctica TaxID=1902245 RepID=A0A3G9A1I9_9ACTN|nr:precorrin-3B synthase [Nakamurella antarctica]